MGGCILLTWKPLRDKYVFGFAEPLTILILYKNPLNKNPRSNRKLDRSIHSDLKLLVTSAGECPLWWASYWLSVREAVLSYRQSI